MEQVPVFVLCLGYGHVGLRVAVQSHARQLLDRANLCLRGVEGLVNHARRTRAYFLLAGPSPSSVSVPLWRFCRRASDRSSRACMPSRRPPAPCPACRSGWRTPAREGSARPCCCCGGWWPAGPEASSPTIQPRPMNGEEIPGSGVSQRARARGLGSLCAKATPTECGVAHRPMLARCGY